MCVGEAEVRKRMKVRRREGKRREENKRNIISGESYIYLSRVTFQNERRKIAFTSHALSGELAGQGFCDCSVWEKFRRAKCFSNFI